MIRELALVAALLMIVPLGSASAQEIPMPPATFFGAATVDGHSVSDGTPVLALIDGKVCGEGAREPGQTGTWTATEAIPEYGIEGGDSLYVVDVVSDSQVAGCGTDGVTVTFLVGGKPAHEKGIWIAGANRLNLTAGTPPDAEQLATTPGDQEAPASPASEAGASEDNNFSWWPAVAAGGGLLAVALAAALWQARRTARGKHP